MSDRSRQLKIRPYTIRRIDSRQTGLRLVVPLALHPHRTALEGELASDSAVREMVVDAGMRGRAVEVQGELAWVSIVPFTLGRLEAGIVGEPFVQVSQVRSLLEALLGPEAEDGPAEFVVSYRGVLVALVVRGRVSAAYDLEQEQRKAGSVSAFCWRFLSTQG